MSFSKSVLIIGGRGALGSTLVESFKLKNWWVGSVGHGTNSNATANFIIDSNVHQSLDDQAGMIAEKLKSDLGDGSLDSIICVAGGWAGGSAKSKDFLKNSELMWRQSVEPSLISAKLASKFLNENGVLVMTGASAAVDGTPGMIGYGIAKAAVHHLVKSLGKEKSGLPNSVKVVAILPATLDTPNNRKWMKDADTSVWTPLSDVANVLGDWIECPESVPGRSGGSLVKLETAAGKTETVLVE